MPPPFRGLWTRPQRGWWARGLHDTALNTNHSFICQPSARSCCCCCCWAGSSLPTSLSLCFFKCLSKSSVACSNSTGTGRGDRAAPLARSLAAIIVFILMSLIYLFILVQTSGISALCSACSQLQKAPLLFSGHLVAVAMEIKSKMACKSTRAPAFNNNGKRAAG